jgi:tRNA dimethylallyltransferase
MHSFRNLKPLVVILGPTASGKTEAAIQIANSINGEIISCDSRLFYRGMDIGTAKPTKEERVRVPHHMIDIAEPDEPLSLAVFQQMCKGIIDNCHNQGKIPLLVGGTGQYISAVTEGYVIPKQVPSTSMRLILEQLAIEGSNNELYRYLKFLDPVAAQSIDKRNMRRVVRALEVILLTGRRFSDQKKKSPSQYKIINLGINWSRVDLYQRIDLRVDKMFEHGFINEVKSLLEKGYTSRLPGMSAIGYNEITYYLFGKLTLQETITLIKRKTRQFVRRQSNWFKLDDPNIFWVSPDGQIVDNMIKIIDNELCKYE